ncbi:hypothetical protein B0I35DRAFT_197926 [Stachybotrys elegans]|uniref:SnoaL-like domain-containing protein n=1 Tax=Stachybotrys elegans TaxID=80388 RepID=A0A8K0STU6_9HYPO|nr:hypothetical protein B0I35DRAFT_197926 [Stachybotrys elegans]
MSHVSPEVALAITRQKARYARYADTKQWDKWADLALPDATMAYLLTDGKPLAMGPQLTVWDSSKASAAFFEKFFRSMESLHNIAPGDFEAVAPDEVKAIFGFEDQVLSAHLPWLLEIRGGGYYYETWKLVDGEWYIKELRMRRTYQKESLLVQVGVWVAKLLDISI